MSRGILRQCLPNDKCLPNGQDSANACQLHQFMLDSVQSVCQCPPTLPFFLDSARSVDRLWAGLQVCDSMCKRVQAECCQILRRGHRRLLVATHGVNPQRGGAAAVRQRTFVAVSAGTMAVPCRALVGTGRVIY